MDEIQVILASLNSSWDDTIKDISIVYAEVTKLQGSNSKDFFNSTLSVLCITNLRKAIITAFCKTSATTHQDGHTVGFLPGSLLRFFEHVAHTSSPLFEKLKSSFSETARSGLSTSSREEPDGCKNESGNKDADSIVSADDYADEYGDDFDHVEVSSAL